MSKIKNKEKDSTASNLKDRLILLKGQGKSNDFIKDVVVNETYGNSGLLTELSSSLKVDSASCKSPSELMDAIVFAVSKTTDSEYKDSVISYSQDSKNKDAYEEDYFTKLVRDLNNDRKRALREKLYAVVVSKNTEATIIDNSNIVNSDKLDRSVVNKILGSGVNSPNTLENEQVIYIPNRSLSTIASTKTLAYRLGREYLMNMADIKYIKSLKEEINTLHKNLGNSTVDPFSLKASGEMTRSDNILVSRSLYKVNILTRPGYFWYEKGKKLTLIRDDINSQDVYTKYILEPGKSLPTKAGVFKKKLNEFRPGFTLKV